MGGPLGLKNPYTPISVVNVGHPLRLPWSQRVDFPRFSDGDDPLTWIYKGEQYFACYHTLAPHKVLTALFYLEDEAMQWFKWHNCILTTPTWEEFTSELSKEFGPSEFEDCTEALFKLRQTSTLKDYVSEFRRLANRAHDVGHVLLKSCFLGGLKRELIYDVKLLRPATVHDAISIAIQVDSKLSAHELSILKPFLRLKPLHYPYYLLNPKPLCYHIVSLLPKRFSARKRKWNVGFTLKNGWWGINVAINSYFC